MTRNNRFVGTRERERGEERVGGREREGGKEVGREGNRNIFELLVWPHKVELM